MISLEPNSSTVPPVPAPRALHHRQYVPQKKGRLLLSVLSIRTGLLALLNWYYRRVWKMDLHPSVRFSLSAKLDLTNPRGVHIGAGTYLAFGSVVLSHDMSRLVHAHTTIGRNCFIGARSIILPGITIGDECIIGTGAVVTKDVPSHTAVAGNPARVIRTGIRTRERGIMADAQDLAVTGTGPTA